MLFTMAMLSVSDGGDLAAVKHVCSMLPLSLLAASMHCCICVACHRFACPCSILRVTHPFTVRYYDPPHTHTLLASQPPRFPVDGGGDDDHVMTTTAVMMIMMHI